MIVNPSSIIHRNSMPSLLESQTLSVEERKDRMQKRQTITPVIPS
jgi:hypothetical protein